MISKELTNAINDQIQKELASAYLYLGMATHFHAVGLGGFAHWMHTQADEERDHAEKLYHFLFEVGSKPVLKAIPEVKVEYGDPKSVIEQVLKHEESISASIDALYKLAMKEEDFKVMSFLQWFIDEQVEEESSVQAILDMFKYCDNNAGLMILNNELGKRGEK